VNIEIYKNYNSSCFPAWFLAVSEVHRSEAIIWEELRIFGNRVPGRIFVEN
jgi:hypothetical protein